MTTEERKNQPKAANDKKPVSRRRKIARIAFAVALVLVIIELIWSNSYIRVERFTYKNQKIPKDFDGVRIVQVSDYHNHGGSYDDRLIEKIKNQNPDYIFLTGDIADQILTDIDKANAFLEKVSKIADCYLVWGNHDLTISDSDRQRMADCCEQNGITVLENEYTVIERGNSKMLLVGTDNIYDDFDKCVADLPTDCDFTVWLHHYPEDFEYICDEADKVGINCDLYFAGHAHGGLFGLPFTRLGLYAPGQGFFPKYTGGEYFYNDSEMLLSRGVGNSGYTKRFFDPFHLVVCTLESE